MRMTGKLPWNLWNKLSHAQGVSTSFQMQLFNIARDLAKILSPGLLSSLTVLAVPGIIQVNS